MSRDLSDNDRLLRISYQTNLIILISGNHSEKLNQTTCSFICVQAVLQRKARVNWFPYTRINQKELSHFSSMAMITNVKESVHFLLISGHYSSTGSIFGLLYARFHSVCFAAYSNLDEMALCRPTSMCWSHLLVEGIFLSIITGWKSGFSERCWFRQYF